MPVGGKYVPADPTFLANPDAALPVFEQISVTIMTIADYRHY